MESVKVKTKSGKDVYVLHLEDEEMSMSSLDNNEGLCIRCGEFAYGVEPDARKYECECCGENGVYGLEELLMMGYVR